MNDDHSTEYREPKIGETERLFADNSSSNDVERYHEEKSFFRFSINWEAVLLWLSLVLVIIFMVLFVSLALRKSAGQSETAPNYPVVVIQPEERRNDGNTNMYEFWKGRPDWLPLSAHTILRHSHGVYNLVFFERGTVRYNSNSISVNDPSWKESNGQVGLSFVAESHIVHVNAQGFEYTINIFQPFVLSFAPDRAYLINGEGKLLVTDIFGDNFKPEEEVEFESPVEMPINPELSL